VERGNEATEGLVTRIRSCPIMRIPCMGSSCISIRSYRGANLNTLLERIIGVTLHSCVIDDEKEECAYCLTNTYFGTSYNISSPPAFLCVTIFCVCV
jgi:hypothetical protein